MANTIQIKRSAYNGTTAPGSLSAGEMAFLQGSSPKKWFMGRQTDVGGTTEVFQLATLEDLTAGDGLAITAAASATVRARTLSVNVDDSSIETNSDTLRIKAVGITNAMLAGSIANAKLSNSAITVTAGNGLKTGGSVSLGSSVTVDMDLNELTAATVDVAADSIAIVDANDSNGSKKESIADLVTAMAGTGLSASAGVLAASSTELTGAVIDLTADSFPFIDATDSGDKKEAVADFIGLLAGDALVQDGTTKDLDVNVDGSSIEINSDALRVKAGGITNTMLAGSIANAKLANSSITVGDQSTALGATVTAITGITDLDVASAGALTIFDTVGANTLTIGAAAGTVNIAGNLTVTGSNTVIESTTVVIDDPLLKLSKDSTTDTVDIGFYGRYSDDSGTTIKYKGIFSDVDNADTFTFFRQTEVEPTTTVNTGGTNYALAGIKCYSVDAAIIDGGSF
jgi:hypothetical protein